MTGSKVKILVVEKTGIVKEVDWKNFSEEDIYKKANLKKPDGFQLHTTYHAIVKVNQEKVKYDVDVYGKDNGRANMENKYEFPPPIDNTLFFGNVVLVARDNEKNAKNLTNLEWKKIYEVLYGGFEDLDSVDTESSEDEEEGVQLTKSGYAKDGFVVDDKEDFDDDYLDCSSELSDDDYI